MNGSGDSSSQCGLFSSYPRPGTDGVSGIGSLNGYHYFGTGSTRILLTTGGARENDGRYRENGVFNSHIELTTWTASSLGSQTSNYHVGGAGTYAYFFVGNDTGQHFWSSPVHSGIGSATGIFLDHSFDEPSALSNDRKSLESSGSPAVTENPIWSGQ